MSRERVLVVDDQAQVRALCLRALTGEGYQVSLARDGADALNRAEQDAPNLVIIDVVMPGMDGVELCRRLRAASGLSGVPILFLTAKQDIIDKAVGFAVGGDDYLTKPFDVRELLMRARALLRRPPLSQELGPIELTVGQLRIDRHSFTVATPDKTVSLTPTEFDLLYYLMSHPQQVHSSEKLLCAVWGYASSVGSGDPVRTHIRNIRKKIEPDGAAPRYLRTVKRRGYIVEG
jgi:DNA-binding response OmpR family regulator